MCDIKRCLLTILYPNTDAKTACDEECYYNGKKLCECEGENEQEEKTEMILDIEKIKRKKS